MRGSAVRAVSCSSESVETVVASMRSGRLKRRPALSSMLRQFVNDSETSE